MGWPLLPNALRPFEIYFAPPTIISQLVLFLWQTVEIDPLGRLLKLPKLCQKMRPRDIVRDSHSHSWCSTVFLMFVTFVLFLWLPYLYLQF